MPDIGVGNNKFLKMLYEHGDVSSSLVANFADIISEMEAHPENLRLLPTELSNNYDLVMTAVKRAGHVLMYAPGQLRSDYLS